MQSRRRRLLDGLIAHGLRIKLALHNDTLAVALCNDVCSRTQNVRRRILDKFCEEHGELPAKSMLPRHVLALRDKISETPEAANQLLKFLRQHRAFCVMLSPRMTTNGPLTLPSSQVRSPYRAGDRLSGARFFGPHNRSRCCWRSAQVKIAIWPSPSLSLFRPPQLAACKKIRLNKTRMGEAARMLMNNMSS